MASQKNTTTRSSVHSNKINWNLALPQELKKNSKVSTSEREREREKKVCVKLDVSYEEHDTAQASILMAGLNQDNYAA